MRFSSRTYRIAFYLGLVCLLLTPLSAIYAMEYEFRQDPDGPSDYHKQAGLNNSSVPYESFSPENQRMIRGALDGNSYTAETAEGLPGDMHGTLIVEYQNEYYAFTTTETIVWTSAGGVATIAVGLLAVGSLLFSIPGYLENRS